MWTDPTRSCGWTTGAAAYPMTCWHRCSTWASAAPSRATRPAPGWAFPSHAGWPTRTRDELRRRTTVLAASSRSVSRYGDRMERSAQRLGRALVVIVDDRVAHGEQDDNSGPLVTELLEEAGFIVDGTVAVEGEVVDIRAALNTAVIGGVDLVVTVGGTGVSPRDVTPDATQGVLDRPIHGIAEALRASGLAASAVAAGISRGLLGVSGSTLVVNLAGSRSAVRDGMATLSALVPYVIEQLSGLDEE